MTRTRVLQVLAGFWILDGLLQLQPAMFTMAMIQSVMQPETTGQPVWMQEIVRWVIAVLSWNLPLANGLIGGIQLLLGAALLWRGRERTWPLWASLAWAALLWIFGQGLGGVLTGQASLLSGAPGSAALYALLTWAAWPLPAPSDSGREGCRREAVAVCLGALWALGAVLQTWPSFLPRSGLTGLVLGAANGQPAWLSHLLHWGAAGIGRAPVATNAAAVILMALIAAGIWSAGRLRRPALLLSLAFSAWAWLFGQALGGIFSGMATDPNSAPLYAVVALSVWGPGIPTANAGSAGPGCPVRSPGA